jgi:RNA polymerase sigma-54 factor
MMIKEVAEEIGVHPSTVSRAVANKYAHTPQGVLELRFFFSEGSNGPEGADTPLLVLKRKVKKLIEDEDARHPLTDDQLAAMLQIAGHSAHPPHRGQVPRGYEYSPRRTSFARGI